MPLMDGDEVALKIRKIENDSY